MKNEEDEDEKNFKIIPFEGNFVKKKKISLFKKKILIHPIRSIFFSLLLIFTWMNHLNRGHFTIIGQNIDNGSISIEHLQGFFRR